MKESNPDLDHDYGWVINYHDEKLGELELTGMDWPVFEFRLKRTNFDEEKKGLFIKPGWRKPDEDLVFVNRKTKEKVPDGDFLCVIDFQSDSVRIRDFRPKPNIRTNKT